MSKTSETPAPSKPRAEEAGAPYGLDPADGAYLGSGFGATQLNLKSPFPDPGEHERLVAFRRLTLALGSELELSRRIQRAVREIRMILGAERTTVFIYDGAARALWTRVHDGTRAHDLHVPIGSGIVGRVAERVRPLNVKDVLRYPGHNPDYDRLAGFVSRSVLAVPMTTEDGNLLGVVQALNKKDGEHFSAQDEKTLVSLAQVLAINVEHAGLYTETRQQLAELQKMRGRLEHKVSELELLYAGTREVAAALGPDDLSRRFGKLLLTTLSYRAVLVLYAPGGAPCVRAMLVRDRDGTGQVEEIAMPGWLGRSDEETLQGISLLGRTCFGLESPPAMLLRFPERSGDVRGALAVFESANAGPISEDDRKVLIVVLAQLVAGFRRAFELESARREDRLRTIGRIMSSMLHDLRTPMAVIGGYAQLLRNGVEADARDRYAEGIKGQLERIKRMSEDVLAYARGDITVLPEKVFLRPFMDSLEQTCRKAFEGTGVRFDFEVGDRGAARFDTYKMDRVLLNLCRNAVESMEPGGRCTVRLDRDGQELHFVVEDEGVGIPEQVRARIFEDFQTHGKKGGTGLGLSMARRIIEAHGGRIHLESTLGAGTRVHLWIPVEFHGGSGGEASASEALGS